MSRRRPAAAGSAAVTAIISTATSAAARGSRDFFETCQYGVIANHAGGPVPQFMSLFCLYTATVLPIDPARTAHKHMHAAFKSKEGVWLYIGAKQKGKAKVMCACILVYQEDVQGMLKAVVHGIATNRE